jgi:cytochrome c oxidase subunit II
MKVHQYEKAFLGVSIVLLIACALALVYSTVVMGIHLPGNHGRVDPARLTQTPPFDQPGVREVAPGEYEAVIIGRAWSFEPNEIRVPAGSKVTFISSSTDVIHGIQVTGTRINVMLIPGQISRVEYTFREPGEHLLICHEYCGLGHHTMGGRVIIE